MSLFQRLPAEIIMMIIERLPDLLTRNKLLNADETVRAVYVHYCDQELERALRASPSTSAAYFVTNGGLGL